MRLDTTVDDAVPIYVIGDSGRLTQILDNLLDNAIKFTAAGSVSLAVRPSPGPGEIVEFRVADTGSGIPKDRRAEIFEPFQRLNPSAPGVGLGLAISGRLAESMAGVLRLTSSGPHGSTFVAALPLQETTAPATKAHATSIPHEQRTSRILVVEDSLETQMLAAAQLDRLGYEHDIVGDGYQALEISDATSYGAILMDWHLPGMDGLETTRRMRQREESEGRKRTPIISVTARAMVPDIEACRDAGADDFVAKPVSLARVGEVLKQWAGSSPPSNGDVDPSFDTEAFANLLDELGDLDLVVSLARTFLTELPRRVSVIVQSGSDQEAIQLAAHTLKSASLMVGAEPLGLIAGLIEGAVRDRSSVTTATQADLHAAAESAENEVSALIERLENAQ
ncbi:MAG: ATP-binding protein [Acidimicrobiales bacterium]